MLQTEKKSFYHERVVGDPVGAFTVEKAPAGKLRFRTKSNPYHRVDGIHLAANTERDILLILDSGHDEIRGRVLDDRGRPIAVSHINLTWSLVKDGVRSTSRRTTAADAQGNFRFTQLGPGSHTISVSAPGYKPVQHEHDVAEQGFDVTVRLEAQ